MKKSNGTPDRRNDIRQKKSSHEYIRKLIKNKPVLQIQGEKLDALTMAYGLKSAKKAMMDAVEKDLHTRFANDPDVYVAAAYSCSPDEAEQ